MARPRLAQWYVQDSHSGIWRYWVHSTAALYMLSIHETHYSLGVGN